ncbi:branched-chain amino acid ABC transporter substrate-binding protein [Herbaspirillum sp. SJZ099]|uniref:branched-chain amino acid ABC transporter substrate-binding protein n=1 Tax=Herbaspirillum sp. SJZ099 TaxID=2572916 RepID=UPI0011A2D424|nr:branched-chain amino acid ABC transporter substrate-binding protein [Herbaspirillum sp. SJZ099]TWC69959.1 amino acid/amide ABC transporter substrate-binding protein (HAAT family) [Herbaspirillum sp. SJZ099]
MNVSYRRRWLWAIASLLLAGMTQAADRTVVIGCAAPLSGPSAATGASLVRAAQIAIDDLNRQPIYLNGDKLVFKLLSQDDRSDPRTGVLVANYLVKSDVVGVVGHWNSGVSLLASRIYNEVELAQIAPGSTARSYTQQAFSTTFRIVAHDDEGVVMIAEYVLREMKARRIAVIDDGTPFGSGYAGEFSKQVVALGGEVVLQGRISHKTSDFNDVMKAVKAAAPDVIFFGGLDAQAGQLVREMRRFGTTVPLIGGSGLVSALFLKTAGDAGEGTIGLEPGARSYKGEQWQRFEKAYSAQGAAREDMSIYAPFVYDAVRMLAAAIKQANTLDRRKITQTLHEIRYEGMTGSIAFDTEGNVRNPILSFYQVKNRQWMAIRTIGGRKE